jgi:phosphoglycolate phosphatase
VVVKGIVFDLDSTLIESDVDFVKMKQRMIKLLEDEGFSKGVLSPTDMTTVKIMELAEEDWKKQGKQEKDRKMLREMITVIMDQGEMDSIKTLKEIPGAREAVKSLKDMGYKLAILTRSHYEYAVEALKKAGMLEYFDLVLGRGQTPQPKPYREALEHTVQLMGLRIEDVIMVGDHQIDCDSATNCSCRFIGVATGHRGLKSWANETPPPVLLQSVAELPIYLDENCP